MISSGLCLFCRFIFVGFGCNKSSHSTWTNFSDGGQLHFVCHFERNTVVDREFSLLARPFRQPSRLTHAVTLPGAIRRARDPLHFVCPFE